MIRRDPGQTTLFAGDTELIVNTSASPAVLAGALLYYTLGGTENPVAVRSTVASDPGVRYEMDTPQGTATKTMNATSQGTQR